MACEKYSGWMTDGALGALSGEREAELRAHAAGCANCRRERDALRTLVQAVDRSVEALVAGEPSPQFAAQLRARIAEEPAPTAWPFFTWRQLAVAALAAAALFAVWMVRSLEHSRGPSPIAANTQAETARPPAAETVAAPEGSSSRRSFHRAHGRAASLSMEVLVPKGQLAAGLLWSEGVREGTIDGAQLSLLAERSAEPLEMKALVIEPLETPAVAPPAEAASPDGGRE
jgi:hypothetical protein